MRWDLALAVPIIPAVCDVLYHQPCSSVSICHLVGRAVTPNAWMLPWSVAQSRRLLTTCRLFARRCDSLPNQVKRMVAVAPENATYALSSGDSPIGIGHSGTHPGYVNLMGRDPDDDVAIVIVMPFMDYVDTKPQGDLQIAAGLEAKEIAGYPRMWSAATPRSRTGIARKGFRPCGWAGRTC